MTMKRTKDPVQMCHFPMVCPTRQKSGRDRSAEMSSCRVFYSLPLPKRAPVSWKMKRGAVPTRALSSTTPSTHSAPGGDTSSDETEHTTAPTASMSPPRGTERPPGFCRACTPGRGGGRLQCAELESKRRLRNWKFSLHPVSSHRLAFSVPAQGVPDASSGVFLFCPQ